MACYLAKVNRFSISSLQSTGLRVRVLTASCFLGLGRNGHILCPKRSMKHGKMITRTIKYRWLLMFRSTLLFLKLTDSLKTSQVQRESNTSHWSIGFAPGGGALLASRKG